MSSQQNTHCLVPRTEGLIAKDQPTFFFLLEIVRVDHKGPSMLIHLF